MRVGRLCLAVMAVTGAARADVTMANLAPRADLMPEMAALPRLTDTGPAADRINARLAALDAAQLQFARDCNTAPPDSFVERFVTVTFTGPEFLSMLDSVGFYCPGATHPDFGAQPLTFDLQTGSEVDVHTLLPARFWTDSHHASSGSLQASPALVTLYLDHDPSLPQDCRAQIAARPGRFDFWLDRAGLVLMPSGLPHAMQDCADPVTLPLSVLREAGFAARLIAALGG